MNVNVTCKIPIPQEEDAYLIAYNRVDGVTFYETCNQEALVSRLANHFEGKEEEKIKSIQVMVINEEYPFFKEIGRRKLREMHKAHKNSLEDKTSS